MRMPQSRHKPVIADDFDSRLEWGFGIFHSCDSCAEIQALDIAHQNISAQLSLRVYLVSKPEHPAIGQFWQRRLPLPR